MCEHHAALGVAIERDLPHLPTLAQSPIDLGLSAVEPTELPDPAADVRASVLGILTTAKAEEAKFSGDAKKRWQDRVLTQLAKAADFPLRSGALDGRCKALTIVELREVLIDRLGVDAALPGFILATQAPKKSSRH